MRRKREQIGELADRRKLRLTEQLDGPAAGELLQIQFDILREPRQIRDHQDLLIAVAADKRQDAVIRRSELFVCPAAQGRIAPAQGDQPLHPPQQRRRILLLRLDVHRGVEILGVDDDRRIEALRVGSRKAGVAVGAPLHRRPHAVAVAEIDVVAHADLVAVVDHRRAGQREQQAVHQFDRPPIVLQQRGQPAADAQIDPRLRIAGVDAKHVVALFVGHHLERQLVVVAQEDEPTGSSPESAASAAGCR